MMHSLDQGGPTRRQALTGLVAITVVPVAASRALAQDLSNDSAVVMRALVGAAPVKVGKVKLEMPPLAENGNSVPLIITVDSPMTAADHVTAIHVFSERNPIATVVNFHLGPRAGRAKVQTNIRLATTQVVTALARMNDGSYWSGTAEVIVTLAACVDSG